MYHVTLNKKKLRREARIFGKARNRQKQFWPPPGLVWLGTLPGASWIACCPSTICTRFPYYRNKSNQIICIYLLEIFCSSCSLAYIICFEHSRLGRFIENDPSTFCNVSINKKSSNCLSRVSWVAKYWYWQFHDSINVDQESINAVQLPILCF